MSSRSLLELRRQTGLDERALAAWLAEQHDSQRDERANPQPQEEKTPT